VSIVKLFLGIFLVQLIHLALMAVTGLLWGARLKEVSVGLGPVIKSIPSGNMLWKLRLLPLNGHLQFWQRDSEQELPENIRLYDELPGYQRALTQLSGPVGILLLGSLLAGSWLGKSALDGALDMVRGAWGPTTVGPTLIASIVKALETLTFSALLGQIFAKFAAWNLLPLPPLNGGAALLDLVVPNSKRGVTIRTRIALVSSLLMMVGFVAWVVAFVSYLMR
jgi:membrane-associated protease RseP (regulator of RpoE activity)